ncbi:hypothetical protein A5634_17075 [Mycobacterium asiaticum]|uniref:Anti-sigma-D factor RsdA sigma factor binding region domain-containing protein n=1 Tax=Mycobacterium asiaticum TaxID=1790 RepID=A0A1A3P9K1_MYCAS|nr:hypothetical protein A5634_17075 [Mycobacterium asiaticum]
MRNFGSDFGAPRGEQPALDEVSRTDLLLDALAARTESQFGPPGEFDDFDDQALTALLGDWRDDLRWPPASALVSQDEAEDALRAGMMARGHGRRGLAAVGSVAATLLMLSGFGAVVADAKPGDLLYGLHAMMLNEPRVSDDSILLSAKADLAKVEQMIAQGQWDQAQSQLAEVSSTLRAVNDGGRRQGLLDEVNQLNTKVEKRDPNATVRPATPPTTELAVPSAPAKSWTPLAPATEPAIQSQPPAATAPATEPSTDAPEPTEPANPEVSATLTPTTTPPTTTNPSSTTSPTTTTKPKSTTTTPSTGPSTTTTTPSTVSPHTTQPSSSKPGTSASATPSGTPNSPAAAASSPVPTSQSGQLWDRTTGPASPTGPRTPFPKGTAP